MEEEEKVVASISPRPIMFFREKNWTTWATLKLSSANALKLDQGKIVSFSKRLKKHWR